MSTRKRRLTALHLTLDDLHQRERVLKQAVQLVFSHAFVEETVLWPAVRTSGPDAEELTTAAVVFHSDTGARKARNTGRVPSDKAVPSSRNSSSAAPPTRANRIWAIPPGESPGYAPPATRARACARRGPLHGTRE
ncbi:hypothetical protein GCM10010448_06610 [Streptomyces glomeratus]|uniref:Hemerythrin-like domain-containing protein n=1 Tax=Streptomyces glomeratus TaxID=284452 RepID=A0ABP6L347_9ACTN